jgi:hypothetical protein
LKLFVLLPFFVALWHWCWNTLISWSPDQIFFFLF